MQAFENDGAVPADLHLDPDLLDRAEAVWDRFDRAEDATPQSILRIDYVELISAPVFGKSPSRCCAVTRFYPRNRARRNGFGTGRRQRQGPAQ